MTDRASTPPLAWHKFLVALLAVLAIISAARGCANALAPDGSIDLGMPLKAAQLLQHDNPYRDYVPGDQALTGTLQPHVNPFVMTPVHVPSALMLLWPYSGLSWPAAKLAWLISNLFFTAGGFALAVRRFLPDRSPWLTAALASLLMISFPWRIVIGNGQHLMASLFFFLLSAELAQRGHRIWSGVALAASFLKYTVILFLLPWFALKRQWTPLAIAFAIHGLMTLGIAIHLGENPLVLVQQALGAGTATLLVSGYIDLFAVADWLGAPLALAAKLAVALVVAVLWLGLRRPPPDEHPYLASLCFVSVVVVYHRLYDTLVLLIPLLIALGQLRKDRLVAMLILATISFCWFIDRLVLALSPWLGRAAASFTTAYAALVASLFYLTLLVLLHRQFRAAPSDLEGRVPGSHPI